MSHIQISIVDFVLVIQVILQLSGVGNREAPLSDAAQGWQWQLPRPLLKRLSELNERLLEADIWTDSLFQHFLGQKLAGNPSLFESESATLYAAYVNLTPPPHCLFNSILQITKSRLSPLAQSISMSSDLVDLAWRMFEYALLNESKLKLVANRHVDCVLLASIKIALMTAGSNAFPTVLSKYMSLPQFLPSTVAAIQLTDTHDKGDIETFVTRVYLPKMSPYLEARNLAIPAFARFQVENYSHSNVGNTREQRRVSLN